MADEKTTTARIRRPPAFTVAGTIATVAVAAVVIALGLLLGGGGEGPATAREQIDALRDQRADLVERIAALERERDDLVYRMRDLIGLLEQAEWAREAGETPPAVPPGARAEIDRLMEERDRLNEELRTLEAERASIEDELRRRAREVR